MKRLLWWLIAGTKGGVNRARILVLLHERPCNAHQIAKSLALDYKTIKHHLSVLDKNQIITSYGNKKYGAVYFLSPQLEQDYDSFTEIWAQFGKIQIKDEDQTKGDDSE
jgi:predicted ArsR family transcriptional regulator